MENALFGLTTLIREDFTLFRKEEEEEAPSSLLPRISLINWSESIGAFVSWFWLFNKTSSDLLPGRC